MNEILMAILSGATGELALLAINHFMEPKNKKTKFFVVRLEDALREQFQKACDATDEEPSEVARVCIKAFIEAVERDGEITKPYAIIAKSKLSGKTAALPAHKGRSDAPVALPENLSTDSTRLSLNEDSPADGPKTKSSGLRARSTRPGIAKTLDPKKGKSTS